MARSTTILGTIGLTNGHEGDWMEDSDPKGSRVVHIVVRTQREYDRLHRLGVLDDRHHQAAEHLRNTWEAGTLLKQPAARDVERPMGEGEEREPSWQAWTDFIHAIAELKSIGMNYWLISQNVILHDIPPDPEDLVYLRSSLDHLYDFYR